MISFYFDYFSNFEKARKTVKNEENPRKSRVFRAISFLVALIGKSDQKRYHLNMPKNPAPIDLF